MGEGDKNKDRFSSHFLPFIVANELSTGYSNSFSSHVHIDPITGVCESNSEGYKLYMEFLKSDGKLPSDKNDKELLWKFCIDVIKNLKNKKDHSRGGDVDNHLVDFISVAVGLNYTDKEIRKRFYRV